MARKLIMLLLALLVPGGIIALVVVSLGARFGLVPRLRQAPTRTAPSLR